MSSGLKKRARELQSLTGMSYQAARNQLRNNPGVSAAELAERIRVARSLSKQATNP